ncbi:MAG: protein-glutamate O-methyltransferase CheR [Thiogranum sp.]|nr:protein-glutamate O-methyltransferase CheR [Thiogranum sp.]
MTNAAKRAWAESAGSLQSDSASDFGGLLFAQWRDLLDKRHGLYIAPERRSFLSAGLRSRMRKIGVRSFSDYYDLLQNGNAHLQEWSLLIDVLTVHETRFFRHESSMELVSDVVREKLHRDQPFNVWSVGCATGEEVYSLAMLLDAQFHRAGVQCLFGITGTDISLPALRSARSGIYANKRLQGIGAEFREKYCRAVSPKQFQVDERLRRRVCFTHLNLRDVQDAPFSDIDLIYCQNLLIYMDREKRIRIANALADRLRPGGVLILGPGELLGWPNPHMEKIRCDDTLAYRRVEHSSVALYERN